MARIFEWRASDTDDSDMASSHYDDQAEALALDLSVHRDALLLLSAFSEHASDHERIAACRRAFRRAAGFIHGVKVRTLMLRDSAGDPVAVLGYLDVPPSETELREAIDSF